MEILVCSDGSTDGTERIVEEFTQRDPRIWLIKTVGRRGKPTAVNLLVNAARGAILLMGDVRQPLDPGALHAILPPLADARVGCVSGNLVLTGDAGAGVYWRYEKLIRGSEARLGAMPGVSGSIYAVRRAEMPVLPSDVLLDDMYVPLSIAHDGKKSIVFAEEAKAFDVAVPDEQEFWRKVRTLAGNYQLVAKLPWLLVPRRNPIWLEVVSHKLLRLICPWALALVLLVSVLLALRNDLPLGEATAWRIFALSQFTFYGLCAAGEQAGRLGAVARTFIVMNAAAVAGLFRYLRRSQAVAW
jgi:cellulose synthase/poly-beta-1,6-N-acetylglucosamine synthase-like glycosyltransferase